MSQQNTAVNKATPLPSKGNHRALPRRPGTAGPSQIRRPGGEEMATPSPPKVTIGRSHVGQAQTVPAKSGGQEAKKWRPPPLQR